jgi:hypothetical protein
MERQKFKEARRADTRARRDVAPPRPTDHDPDVAGMVAGPQAPPEWQRQFFEEEQKAKEAAELAEEEKEQS